MGEGELLPKKKTYAAYMGYVEAKRKEIEAYLKEPGAKAGDSIHNAKKANMESARAQALKFLDLERKKRKTAADMLYGDAQ